MNKGLLSFGGLLIVIAGILAALNMTPEPKPPAPTRADAGEAIAAPKPLPALNPVDAAAPPPVIDVAYVKQNGLISMEAQWLDKALEKRDFKRLPDEGAWPTYMAFNEIKVSWKVDKGKIVGAVADFPPHALGATIAGLSPPFFGHQGHFPHLEGLESPAEGEVTTPGGVLKYKCTMNNNDPNGPEHCDFDLVE